jgi:histidinol-phosphate aminotransferase
LTEGLLRRGVIVRPLGAFGLPQCVRISTGTDQENQMLLEGVRRLKESEVRSQESEFYASR